jgi:hypothetical protein
MKKLLLYILVVIPCILSLSAQENSKGKLKIFIEGTRLDFNYVRNNTPFVNFVNDPKVCDVHIIAKRQDTGGGERYSFEYNSTNSNEIPTFKLSCFVLDNDSDEIIRKRITNTIQSGLMPFINEKNGMDNINIVSIERSDSDNELTQDSSIIDPWNNWIFRLGTSIGFEGEDRRSNLEYSFSGRANKITDAWKISNEYDFERSVSIIERDNGEEIRTVRKSQDADVRYVLSLDPHWSTGLFIQMQQSTYRNIELSYEAIPAIQFNIYDWKDSDRKQFTFSYSIGPTHNKYFDTTIFNKNQEWLWKQVAEISFNRVETWGEIDFSLEGGNYFPGFESYYVESDFEISYRISRGVSINFEIQVESIHNQVYLPLSELSDEELFLNTRKLPTNFEYSGRFGISFQFGSIFNNVVNERL